MLHSEGGSEEHLQMRFFNYLLHAMAVFYRILLLLSGKVIIYFKRELHREA